jgi:hypothetical protein
METFRKTIKRIAAIGAGALIACTCFGVAGLATDLSSYPAPFVAGGKWVGLIAVGSAAQAGDIIGATDIAATLAQNVGTTGGTTTISGGKTQDVPIGTSLSTKFGSTLSSTDLAGFQDTSVNIDTGTASNSYNVKDQLTLGTGAIVTTGLFEGSTSKDWGSDVWMKINSTGQIKYDYVFKSNLKTNNYIVNASDTNPIEISFLGKTLRITSATASTITAQIATEYYMNYGDTVTVEGKTVKLINVGSGTTAAVIVSVDGTTGTISGTTITKVNGLRFKIKSTFSSDTPAERAATLLVGADVSKTYTSGDAYIGQDTNTPDWTWNLAGLDGVTPTIGILNAKTLVTPAGTNKPLKAGESLSAPYDFFKIQLGDATTSSYKDYTFNGLGISDLYSAAANTTVALPAAYGLEITATGGGKNAFKVTVGAATKYTDKLFVYANGTAGAGIGIKTYWANPDEGNHYQPIDGVVTNGTSATIATIQTPDTSTGLPLMVYSNVAGTGATIKVDGLQDINQTIALSSQFIKFLGAQTGTATAGDLLIGVDVSTLDASGRTQDGIIVSAIKSNGDSDVLKLSIPSKIGTDFAIRTVISSTGTTTTSAAGAGSMASVPVAKLDTEISNPKDYNLILVGGQAVNKLTAEALGVTYPTYGGDALGIVKDQATLKLVENAFGGTNTALIVAGWEALDTRAAANVLKDYTAYSATLKGKQVIVTQAGTTITLTAPTVAAA